MKSKKYFTICLLLCGIIFTFICTKNLTDTETFIISGVVTLEGETDFSDITVALYAPAELDTAIVNMHKRFPTVGFELTQAAVFDHREAEPVYTTKTDKDGKYNFTNLTSGEYNLVASKDGFGWRYLYNINSETQPADIKLLPEIEVQGTLDLYTIWGAYQHVIVKGDVIVPEGGVLMIDKGAVVRFDANIGLTSYGTLNVNGEEDEFAWFTINEQKIGSFWSGIKVRYQGNSTKINWAMIKYAVNGILCHQTKLNIENCFLINNEQNGVLITNEALAVVKNCFIHNCSINVENKSLISINNNMISNKNDNCDTDGIIISNSESDISDNCFYLLNSGIKIEYDSNVKINNNFFLICNIGLFLGSPYGKATCKILYNTIEKSIDYPISFYGNIRHIINKNNIYKSQKNLLLYANGLCTPSIEEIIVSNNYWGLTTPVEISKLFQDLRYENNNYHNSNDIFFEPFEFELISQSFPR